MRIIYCSCGRNMKSTRSPTEFDPEQPRRHPNPWICDENGIKHGASERQKMCFHAKQMLKKTRQEKHGGHPTILSRWHADADYRKSLCDIGWREHHIILYDRIALEKHIYKATRAQKIQITNNWILTVNSEEGTQLPLNQRPDFSSSEKRMQTIA